MSFNIKNIYRVEAGSNNGWVVQFSRFGVKANRYFPDMSHGSKDWAWFQAIIYLEQMREKLEKSKHKYEFLKKTPGHHQRGIRFARVREYKGAYQVNYVKNDRMARKSYSQKKYGKDKAFQLARRFADVLNEKHKS